MAEHRSRLKVEPNSSRSIVVNGQPESNTVQFLQKVSKYFSSRIIGAIAVVQKGNAEPRFEMASGCLVVVSDHLVWLTAGHFIEQVMNWHESNVLNGLFLIFLVNESIATYAPVEFDADAVFAPTDADQMDAGFVIVGRELASTLLRAEAKAIPVERFGCEFSKGLVGTQLIGYSATHSVIGKAMVHEYKSAGKPWGVHRSEVKEISKRHVLLHPPERDLQNPDRCILRPLSDREPSVGGMSGGLIVAFQPGAPIRDFQVIGIQSSEHSIHRGENAVLTQVACFDAGAILAAVEAQIEQMR